MENISLQRITNSEDTLWTFVESVFEEAFPIDERRKKEHQRKLVEQKDMFSQFVVMRDSIPIGIFSYWDFGNFIFGEHLAISAAQRSGGLGSKILTLAFESSKKPWVLEVEKPESSEMAARRVGLYER